MTSKNKVVISKIKRQILTHVKLVRALIMICFLVFILIVGFFLYKGISQSIIGTSVGLTRDFIFPSTNRILTENGRINVLLLGIGGAGHEGADLTDTMILASVSTKTQKITLISLPRDIWIPELSDKINSAYMYGKQKGGTKTGLALAKSTVEEILGTQIDYAVVLDFSSFKEVVDALGGISVNVKNSFTDSQYPIAGKENDLCNGDPTYACRYMTITFEAGTQDMDGKRALEFVRSRHAVGPEGNDIAREARQQLVIGAIVKKILTPKIFTNLNIDNKLLNIVSQSVITDLKPAEEATLARYVVDAKSNIKSYSIPDNLLYNPPNEYKYFGPQFTHAFVFIPARSDGKWDDVESWVQTILP